MIMDAQAQAVLDFWFLAPDNPGHGQSRAEWFRKDDAFDAQIRERFGALIDTAINGGLRDWAATPRGALAQILLLDQFTRNVYRGTPRAFAGDAQALELAIALTQDGQDQQLEPTLRRGNLRACRLHLRVIRYCELKGRPETDHRIANCGQVLPNSGLMVDRGQKRRRF